MEGIEISVGQIANLPSGQFGKLSYMDCDTLIFTGDWIPEHELAQSGGLSLSPVTRGPEVDSAFRTSEAGIFAAGNLLRGVETADHCALEGRRAARGIVQFLKQRK